MIFNRKGSITVFLAMVGIFFLALACTVTESVHTEGCRMAAAQITDLGVFSVLGEYEKAMLDKYDLMMLDGGRGSNRLNLTELNDLAGEYMQYHLSRFRTWIFDGNFSPWRSDLLDCSLTGVTLASDRAGDELMRQAATYEKETIGINLLDHFLEWQRQGTDETFKNEQYNNAENNAGNAMEHAEEKQREVDPSYGIFEDPDVVKAEDPRKTVNALKRKGILGLVLGENTMISAKEVRLNELPSHRWLNTGSLSVQDSMGALEKKAYFTVYAADHFSCYPGTSENILNYQQEYLLAGKSSDPENLRSAVNRILLLREGVNFICAWNSPEMYQQTYALAFAVTGIFAIPVLVTATQTAILLAWAYGESLVDMRALMAGRKVAFAKDVTNWQLPLSQLLYLDQVLKNVPPGMEEGMTYQSYMNVLLSLADSRTLSRHAMDLMEAYMRSRSNTAEFRIDNAVTAVEYAAVFSIRPVFMSLPFGMMGVGREPIRYIARQKLGY